MSEGEFIKLLQRRLAQIAIGPSALRNQNEPGIIDILRNYCQHSINIVEFLECLSDEERYLNFLDNHTFFVMSLFHNGDNWGAARKGLNLFLRDVVYNKFFSHRYGLPHDFADFNQAVKFMEIPLDSTVANGIRDDTNGVAPRWDSIIRLRQEESNLFQLYALVIAEFWGIARVNLDVLYWREEQGGE